LEYFVVSLVFFPIFGVMYQEKSGNPAPDLWSKIFANEASTYIAIVEDNVAEEKTSQMPWTVTPHTYIPFEGVITERRLFHLVATGFLWLQPFNSTRFQLKLVGLSPRLKQRETQYVCFIYKRHLIVYFFI
jgi:hypothetical protein